MPILVCGIAFFSMQRRRVNPDLKMAVSQARASTPPAPEMGDPSSPAAAVKVAPEPSPAQHNDDSLIMEDMQTPRKE